MRFLRQELYAGCVENRVYPFLDGNATERDLAGSGYIRVLFQMGQDPTIDVNSTLTKLSLIDVARFQKALAFAMELAIGGVIEERIEAQR